MACDKGVIFLGLGAGRKDEVVRLGCHAHGGKIAYHLGMVPTMQIEIVQPLDAAVVEINVYHRAVIGRAQVFQGITEHEELIHCLGVPGLKHVGEQPETPMRGEPGAPQQQYRR